MYPAIIFGGLVFLGLVFLCIGIVLTIKMKKKIKQGEKNPKSAGRIFKIVGIICICSAILSGIIVTIAVNSIL